MGKLYRWWRLLVEASSVVQVFLVLSALGVSGLMGHFSSLEGAPWPVVILVSAAVFVLTGVGFLMVTTAIQDWYRNAARSAHHESEQITAVAHFKLTGGTPGLDYASNVSSITDLGVGRFTFTWDRPFADDNYHVTVSPNGCVADIEQKSADSLILSFLAPSGESKDPPTISVMAVGKPKPG